LGLQWYGEAEKNLAEIFKLAEEVGKPFSGSILFLDELDSLATSRRSALVLYPPGCSHQRLNEAILLDKIFGCLD
jgi:SpoVK/Ycf46/Vps4 family AAA+-type ATPase